MDGPFGFAPQRRQPGLFNQPPQPMSASSPPNGGGGTPFNMNPPITSPMGGPNPSQSPANRANGLPGQVPITQPAVTPTPGTAPAPYSYGGPSMRLLGQGDAANLTAPAPAPVTPMENGPFMDRFFNRRIMGDGGMQGGFRGMMLG